MEKYSNYDESDYNEELIDTTDDDIDDDTPEYVYSTDEEIFYESIDELNLDDAEEGDRVVIYRGNPVKVSHMDILKEINFVDIIQNAAADVDGEMADNYLYNTDEDLDKKIAQAIDKVLREHADPPDYHRVKNIKPFSITIGEFD